MRAFSLKPMAGGTGSVFADHLGLDHQSIGFPFSQGRTLLGADRHQLPSSSPLTLILILPIIFQAIAVYFEKRKTRSDVNRSVVSRYFYYQVRNTLHFDSVVSSFVLSVTDSSFKIIACKHLHFSNRWFYLAICC